MIKPIAFLLVLGSLSLEPAREPELAPEILEEESISIEFSATSGECAVVIKAESETPLEQVAICLEGERPITELRSNRGSHVALSGFVLESEELSTTRLFEIYPEGEYEMLATTADGRRTKGRATLSHRLPAAPQITFPLEGLAQVPLSPTITWMAAPEATSYTLGVEQHGDDRLIVLLPAGSNRFQVPLGILAGSTETQVEVGAVGANGNCTLYEVTFFTH